MSLFPVPRVLAGLARLESVKETPGLRASLVLFSLLEKKTLMRVVTSLSLALIVLNCLFFFLFFVFFSFGCFLRLAVGLFWLRFVLISDRFLADCIIFSALSLFE